MKVKILVKSLLDAYKYLGRIVESIDKQVIDKGMNSHYTIGFSETLDTFNLVIELVERKRRLCCLKYLIEEGLVSIPQKSAKLLTLRYFDCMNDSEIGRFLKQSKRTIQRLMEKACGEFYLSLVNKGYNYINLKEYLKGEKWLSHIFKENNKKSRKEKIEKLTNFCPIKKRAFLWN